MADRPKTAADVLKMMKDKEVKFLDLRFTDTKGKMQHVTADGSCVDEAMFADGYAFDGSSIAGWKGIEASDMTLMPDPSSAHIDPFFAQTTMAVFCDVLEPSTGEMYERDPRSIAKRAEAYMKQTGVGDTIVFGPEAEFFIFDDVSFTSDPYNTGFKLDSAELPSNSGTEYEMGNLAHRPRTKGGYFPVPPIDSAQDIRSEMLSVMAEMGVVVEKHHHEVASAQHELGIKFGPMVTLADHMQIYKYVIHQVAQAYGKTATLHAQARSSATTARACTATSRSGRARRRCSPATSTPTCRIPACSTSAASSSTPRPSTPSPTRPPTPTSVWCRATRRPCCWPTRPATARRRAASRWCRARRPSASRSASPIPPPTRISAFAAMLMAGLDGIQNKIHPGEAMDKNLYDLPPAELSKIPTVCGSLREALDNLDKNRDFLKKGGVFTDDMIDAYIELKMAEVERFEMTPHPVEFDMYYSV